MRMLDISCSLISESFNIFRSDVLSCAIMILILLKRTWASELYSHWLSTTLHTFNCKIVCLKSSVPYHFCIPSLRTSNGLNLVYVPCRACCWLDTTNPLVSLFQGFTLHVIRLRTRSRSKTHKANSASCLTMKKLLSTLAIISSGCLPGVTFLIWLHSPCKRTKGKPSCLSKPKAKAIGMN